LSVTLDCSQAELQCIAAAAAAAMTVPQLPRRMLSINQVCFTISAALQSSFLLHHHHILFAINNVKKLNTEYGGLPAEPIG